MAYDPYWDGTTQSTNDGNIISSQEVRNMGLDPGLEFGWTGFGSSQGGVNLFDQVSNDMVGTPFDQILQTASDNNEWSAEQAAIQRRWQEEQNQKAMNFSAEQAAMNRDWQKMMSDTAHQREVLDLQNAGLNPVLSATGGNGASVGSGSAASGVTSAGAKGDTDESSTGAIASYLAQMLAAQTSILNTQTSAQASLANAQMMADASKLGSQLSAAAVMGAAGLSSDASMFASEMNFETQRMIQEATSGRQTQQLQWQHEHPTTPTQAAAAAASAATKNDNIFGALARAWKEGYLGEGLKWWFTERNKK